MNTDEGGEAHGRVVDKRLIWGNVCAELWVGCHARACACGGCVCYCRVRVYAVSECVCACMRLVFVRDWHCPATMPLDGPKLVVWSQAVVVPRGYEGARWEHGGGLWGGGVGNGREEASLRFARGRCAWMERPT